jgi:hypothetical protein
MRALFVPIAVVIAVSIAAVGCAPIESQGPVSPRTYPVEFAPTVLDGLPEELVPYQDDWPAFWKGSVKGTRAVSEASVSAWLVELLGVPLRLDSYCVSDGLVFEYEVVTGGILELGSRPMVGVLHWPEPGRCDQTLDRPYFPVDPALVNGFDDLLGSSADLLACVVASGVDCPGLGGNEDTLVRLVEHDPFAPAAVRAGAGNSARVTYALQTPSGAGVVDLDFTRTNNGWIFAGARYSEITNGP